jgi:fructose 1,6-bisphosphate aldolase/phosphatase
MKVTLSIIKADVGSIGGHIKPSQAMIERVKEVIASGGKGLLLDSFVCHTGDDISILSSHQGGVDNPRVHKLCWDAFKAATEIAKRDGLYGAGQDLLKDAFSGNVRGLGPASAEMEFEEREAEPFLLFMADKTEPGAYNLPLYLAFCDPMFAPGLILSPKIKQGFRFTVMDVNYTEGDRVVDIDTPEGIYDLAALLRDNHRFVVDSIRTRSSGEIAAAVSTSRLHNISGKYSGKDDPVMLIRVQSQFPATGEMLAPFRLAHYVSGFSRGSHHGPLMPVKMNSSISFFDGPPIVSCVAFSMRGGRFAEPADAFDHPFWDEIRRQAALKAIAMREQGFSGPAMVGYEELEYGGIVDTLKDLDRRFRVRQEARVKP